MPGGCWSATCLLLTHISQHQDVHFPRADPKGDQNGPRRCSVRRSPVRAPHLPSPLPPCLCTPPWSLQLTEQSFHSQVFLFLMCFRIFLPHEYLVCGSFWPQTYPFALSRDDLYFVPGLSHFSHSFRLSFCLRGGLSHFSIPHHLRSSSSSPCSLPEVVNKDRSE